MKKGKLGIDLGSTYTRLAIFCRELNELFPIQNPDSLNKGALRNGYEDFPSDIYVFDEDGGFYNFVGASMDRQSTSAKFLFYLLARKRKIEVGDTKDMTLEEVDALLSQYPLVNPILRLENDKSFVDRVQRGLHEMFLALARRVKVVCDGQDLEIDEIGLTIPSQWDLNFEDVYRDIVAKAFGEVFPHLKRSNIDFLYETEALAHLLFRHYMELFVSANNANQVVLSLDFGGHNMNGCVENIVDGKTFSTIFKPFGVGGGSELWDYFLTQECEREIASKSNRKLEWLQRHELKNGLRYHKCQNLIGPHNCSGHSASRSAGGFPACLTPFTGATESIIVHLPAATVNETFERAYAGPLRMAERMIRELAEHEVSSSSKVVVVSGGSAMNPTVRKRLKSYCESAGIDVPLFIDDLEQRGYRVSISSNIARGAAYALGSEIPTLQQYLDEGAGFGLIKEYQDEGETHFDVPKLLLHKKNTPDRLKETVGRDEMFSIVCDRSFNLTGRRKNVSYERIHTVLDLPETLEPGNWYFKLTAEPPLENGDQLLKLRVYQHGRTSECRKIEKTIGLHYERGPGCFLGYVVSKSETKGSPRRKFATSCATPPFKRQRRPDEQDLGTGAVGRLYALPSPGVSIDDCDDWHPEADPLLRSTLHTATTQEPRERPLKRVTMRHITRKQA